MNLHTPAECDAELDHIERMLRDADAVEKIGWFQYRRDVQARRAELEAQVVERQAMMAVPASEIAPEPLMTLWRERILVGTITVIAGRPGLGKSTLAATIAAELSRDGHVVVMSSLEDDPNAVIRPRLDAADADLSKVHITAEEVAPLFPADFDEFADMVRRTGARCVILDPIAAHFSPERRVHDRALLGRFRRLARDTGCAIVGIHHSLKGVLSSALDAIGGPSAGLSGTARAVYLYGHDPADQDRRALACVKINGVDEPPALIIEHETVEYSAGDATIEAGLLRIVDQSNATARSVLSPGRRHFGRDAECAQWLTEFLVAGEGFQPSKEIRTAGRAAGFGWQTLIRSGTELKVSKAPLGWGPNNFWVWRLPDDHPAFHPEPEPT